MKKTGFTLAEVLITLAIVGIIAAVTIPGLNRNVSQKSIGPALAKAVNNLNAVNLDALTNTGKTTLDKINESYLVIISSNLNGITEGDTFYGNDGVSYKVGTFTKANGKKDKSSYTPEGSERPVSCLRLDGDNSKLDDACFSGIVAEKYKGWYWPVEIDINGKKGDSKGGSDVFLVYVDTSGAIIPAGSSEAVAYDEKNLKEINCNTDDFDDETGKLCTATVMLDGWNVKY